MDTQDLAMEHADIGIDQLSKRVTLLVPIGDEKYVRLLVEPTTALAMGNALTSRAKKLMQ